MKNLFLIWLILFAITSNVAFAEKAISPVLIAPSNFAKSISKDSIKFTWQNAQNEVNAKVNAYRIVISENAQFNGYSQSTGRCNITCVTSVINSTTFITGLRSSNKAYYWRVQGISPTENGEWSRTGTFKTDVPVPSITNASATPSPVIQGSTLNIAATLSGILPSNYSVKLSDNGNLYAMNGSGTSYSFSQSPTIIGTRNYSVGVYDINNNLKSSLYNGNYDVKKPNTAPTLNLISGNATATTGTTYTMQLQGNDADNNLSQITINWGDGSSNSQNATSGSNLTFTHTYNTANSYTWSATAYDSVNASSSSVAKTVSVSKANVAPTLSFISGNTTATTGTNYTVQLQGNDTDNNLSQIIINWGDGSSNSQNATSGSNLTFTHIYATANSYTWSATAYDSASAGSESIAKTVSVSKANVAPTLSFISGNATATTGTTYTVQLQGNDTDNNLSQITINWGDGSSNSQNAANGSVATFTHTYATANTFTWSATAYDSASAGSESIAKTVSVSKANVAPTLSFISGNATATTGTTYTVQLQGNDTDNNLSQITINWGDGSSNSQNAVSGSTLTFTHTYNTANNYTWSATVNDSANASSEVVSKTVNVTTPIVIPNISSASASPSSTTAGNSINFSATLSSNLPSGYTVKLSYGNSSVSMSGSGTNYSVVQTPTLLGQQVFTVGVYDTNNTLKSNSFTGNFEIVKANSVPTLSFVSGNTTATAGTVYSLQLQANDTDNNLKSISVVWGDGTTDTQNTTNGTTLTFTHTYATANTYNWSATALDSGNASSSAIAKTVTVSAAVVTTPVSTSGYTKISNSGLALPDTAILGSGPNDWACTKDNKTGLIWEVKTTDGGLRDKDWYYSWYKPSGDNGGFAGYTDINVGYGAPNCSTQNNCNTDAFTNAVNTQGLCGKNDWRMPTKDELEGLLTTTSTFIQPINDNLYIDANYFPNTNYRYWSSSPLANGGGGAWSVNFSLGYSYYNYKYLNYFVRLVR